MIGALSAGEMVGAGMRCVGGGGGLLVGTALVVAAVVVAVIVDAIDDGAPAGGAGFVVSFERFELQNTQRNCSRGNRANSRSTANRT